MSVAEEVRDLWASLDDIRTKDPEAFAEILRIQKEAEKKEKAEFEKSTFQPEVWATVAVRLQCAPAPAGSPAAAVASSRPPSRTPYSSSSRLGTRLELGLDVLLLRVCGSDAVPPPARVPFANEEAAWEGIEIPMSLSEVRPLPPLLSLAHLSAQQMLPSSSSLPRLDVKSAADFLRERASKLRAAASSITHLSSEGDAAKMNSGLQTQPQGTALLLYDVPLRPHSFHLDPFLCPSLARFLRARACAARRAAGQRSATGPTVRRLPTPAGAAAAAGEVRLWSECNSTPVGAAAAAKAAAAAVEAAASEMAPQRADIKPEREVLGKDTHESAPKTIADVSKGALHKGISLIGTESTSDSTVPATATAAGSPSPLPSGVVLAPGSMGIAVIVHEHIAEVVVHPSLLTLARAPSALNETDASLSAIRAQLTALFSVLVARALSLVAETTGARAGAEEWELLELTSANGPSQGVDLGWLAPLPPPPRQLKKEAAESAARAAEAAAGAVSDPDHTKDGSAKSSANLRAVADALAAAVGLNDSAKSADQMDSSGTDSNAGKSGVSISLPTSSSASVDDDCPSNEPAPASWAAGISLLDDAPDPVPSAAESKTKETPTHTLSFATTPEGASALKLRFLLPDHQGGAAALQIDLAPGSVRVESEAYLGEVELPVPIDDGAAVAAFSEKKKALTITAPLRSVE